MAITVKADMKGEAYFYLSLFFITLTGGVTSVFQSSVFSEASQLPPIYLQAVLR
jgi:equilibrative nucleoside transporter 1/2/3